MDTAGARAISFLMRRLLLLLLFLAGPVLAQQDEETTAPDAVSVAPTARDDQIDARITDILEASGWFEDIAVGVDGGIVFLDGTTDSEDHKAWARNLAQATEDVVAVVNRIDVEQTADWSITPALRAIGDVLQRTVASLPFIVLALVLLPLTWWLSELAARGLRRFLLGGIESPFLRRVVARMLTLPIFLVGLYVVLQVAGLTQVALSLLGGAGVIGIVFGFAFRDIAENFLASLLLSIRQPFRAGDLIEVEGMLGTVQSMNTRSTVMISPEGNQIQIPNASVFKSVITNFTASPEGRDTVAVGIGYDASVSEAQETVANLLAAHEAVLAEPQPMVLVDTLGSSTVNLIAYYWIDVRRYSLLKVRSSIMRQMKAALTEAGISMPDDAREIIFPEGVPLLSRHGAKAIEAEPAPPPEHVAERSEAEGALENEQDEVVERAAAAGPPEVKEGDLLS